MQWTRLAMHHDVGKPGNTNRIRGCGGKHWMLSNRLDRKTENDEQKIHHRFVPPARQYSELAGGLEDHEL